MWNFKGTLWNSTQNILPIHWKLQILYNIEILRALRFKSSYAFLKRPPGFIQMVIQVLWHIWRHRRYNNVIMSMMASQITSPTIVSSTIYSGSDHRKHQNSASLAFVWGIHRWLVNSPHKGPVMREIFLFDDVIMYIWCLANYGMLSMNSVSTW